MDEYNNNASNEAPTLVKATSSGERSLNGRARRDETKLAPHFIPRPGEEALSTATGRPEAHNLTQHHMRINHFLLMKRRQQRFQQSMKVSARPLILFFVFLIVLISLISSSGVNGIFPGGMKNSTGIGPSSAITTMEV